MATHQSVQAPIGHVERGATDPPRPQRRRRGRTLGIDEGLMGVALLAGPANVIMQLAQPGVGYGVMESRVESGRVDLHPFKRARTTFTYLAVATNGRQRGPEGRLPPGREQGPRAGLLDAGKPGVLQRL